jgi:23S rRNA pseudouridine2605 synthase
VKERLQKILSRAGVCSRRKAEELIQDGKVKVNGVVERQLGTAADPTKDEITVNGQPVKKEPLRYFLFNKPDSVISSVKDPAGRKTVMDYFRHIKERIYPVGRLDYHSEGLLIMTNDGDLDYWLTHPSHEVEKVYDVTVRGHYTKKAAAVMEKGVRIESGVTAPCTIEILDYDKEKNKTKVRMYLHEGKNREIRRMMMAYHFPVFQLIRVKYGFLTLEGVKRGGFRKLAADEVRRLYELGKA